MNKVILVGNLTHDPELRTTPNGVSACSFRIAVRRPRAKEGMQQADFLNIVTWRGTAESCAKYLTKGRKVAVSGSIQVRNYEAKDGTKRYVTEIVADEVEFLSSPNRQDDANEPRTQPEYAEAQDNGFTQVEEEELPF